METLINHSDYVPLARLLAASGIDTEPVQAFNRDGKTWLRFPDDLEDAIAAALADRAALDAAGLDDRKKIALRQLAVTHAARVAEGFSADLLGGGKATFQTRPEDVQNWLTAKTIYADAIAAGQGETQGAHMRDATDRVHVLTFDQAHAILAAMAVHGAALMRVNWAHKDAIKAASNTAELDAIDVETGWPS